LVISPLPPPDPLNFIPEKIPKSIEGAKVYHHKAGGNFGGFPMGWFCCSLGSLRLARLRMNIPKVFGRFF